MKNHKVQLIMVAKRRDGVFEADHVPDGRMTLWEQGGEQWIRIAQDRQE